MLISNLQDALTAQEVCSACDHVWFRHRATAREQASLPAVHQRGGCSDTHCGGFYSVSVLFVACFTPTNLSVLPSSLMSRRLGSLSPVAYAPVCCARMIFLRMASPLGLFCESLYLFALLGSRLCHLFQPQSPAATGYYAPWSYALRPGTSTVARDQRPTSPPFSHRSLCWSSPHRPRQHQRSTHGQCTPCSSFERGRRQSPGQPVSRACPNLTLVVIHLQPRTRSRGGRHPASLLPIRCDDLPRECKVSVPVILSFTSASQPHALHAATPEERGSYPLAEFRWTQGQFTALTRSQKDFHLLFVIQVATTGSPGAARSSEEIFKSMDASGKRIDSPLSNNDGSGPLRLDLDIPDHHMERYSVMFENFLGSSGERRPSIIERRQSKLQKKRSLKRLDETKRKDQIEMPKVPQRSATSPQ